MSYHNLEGLYVAIGDNRVSGSAIAQRIGRILREGEEETEERLPVSIRTPRKSKRTDNAGIHVEGLDDVMVRLSRCCTPVPGDEIVGFVTRGRGVSVHRADCANAVSLSTGQSDRVIDVEWDGEADTVFIAAIEVKALDRSRLLRDVSNALSDQHVNIIACSTSTGNDRISRMRFEFELADPQHLDSVISTIRQIDSVYDAYRILPGKGR